jgi:Tol biopolymer transport system component
MRGVVAVKRLRIRVALAGIAILGGGVLFAPVARAAFPGQNGRISFANFDTGGISTMRPDGSQVRGLTHSSTTFDVTSSWSPDGRWIAFDSTRGPGDFQVFIMRSNGSHVRRVTHLGSNGDPSWAPDGHLLVFEHDPSHGCCTDIYTIRPDSTGLHRLTHFTTPTGAAEPEFSPDGSWIAFEQFPGHSSTSAIFLMRANGGHLHRLTQLRMDAAHPEWAPDGSVIAFNNDFTRLIGDIFTIRPDGSDLTRLTHVIPKGEAYFRPAFAPNGKKIVFNKFNPDGPDRVLVMNADGTGIKVIASNGFAPDWGPRREG